MSKLSELFHKSKTLDPDSIEELYIKELEHQNEIKDNIIGELNNDNINLKQQKAELEDMNGDMFRRINELEQQKAELIQVLRDVLGYAGQEEFLEACVKADAVLNKLQKEN